MLVSRSSVRFHLSATRKRPFPAVSERLLSRSEHRSQTW
jgi:hypothetical protein